MQVLFDGPIWPWYSTVWLRDDGADEWDGQHDFIGQSNGLLGTASTGTATLRFAANELTVHFRIELHPDEPPRDDQWEDVVEASYVVRGGRVEVDTEGPQAVLQLEPGTYRLRFCSRGRDAASLGVTEGLEGLDDYLLQAWPAVASPDVVLRVGSTTAEHWHREARGDDRLSRPFVAAGDAISASDPWVRHTVMGRFVDEALATVGLADHPVVVQARADADEFARIDQGHDRRDYFPPTGNLVGTPIWERRRAAEAPLAALVDQLSSHAFAAGLAGESYDGPAHVRHRAGHALELLLSTAGKRFGEGDTHLAAGWVPCLGTAERCLDIEERLLRELG